MMDDLPDGEDTVQPKRKTKQSKRTLAANKTPANESKNTGTYRVGANKDGKGGKVIPKKKKPKEKKTYRSVADDDSTDYETDEECDSKKIQKKKREMKGIKIND